MLMLAQQRLPSVPADDLARIRALYEDGSCFRAFEAASRFGELSQWRGRDELLLAGRLAPHLGAPRLGMALHYRAWRTDPTDPSACCCHAWNFLAQRGPLRAWRFLKDVGSLDEAPDLIRSDWLGTHAVTLARLRDFDAAELWLARAEQLAPAAPGSWSRAPTSMSLKTAMTTPWPRRDNRSKLSRGAGPESNRSRICSSFSTDSRRQLSSWPPHQSESKARCSWPSKARSRTISAAMRMLAGPGSASRQAPR